MTEKKLGLIDERIVTDFGLKQGLQGGLPSGVLE